MKDKEMFDGFCITLVKKAKVGASYAIAEEIVGKSVKNPTKDIEDVKTRGKAYYDNINEAACQLFKELTSCIEKKLDPRATEVQKIIKNHHALIENFHNATQEVYKAMAQLYAEHPEIRKQLDPFHPRLAVFMAEAMKVFADRELS
ncbi:MAG: hypothetical protein FJZ64_04625 [Chlamydiae bacterium]|nr:hypothetical protein [Chlamydiota bacterium]